MSFIQYQDTAFRSPEQIASLQEQLFHEHLRHCATASPFYRRRLAECGIDATRATLNELSQVPLTAKEDLEQGNDDFLAVPMSKVVDIVQSSGTTGIPTRIMYSDRDLRRLAYNERQAIGGTGVAADDVALLTCSMDRCFIAGLAYYMGLRELGAATIRNGNTTMESHRELMRRMNPTVIVGVPSFLRKLGLYLNEMGQNAGESGVRRLICIGEPLRDRTMNPLPVCSDLIRLWGAQVFSTYASSEIVTSFCECPACNGGHLQAELALVEIVDDAGNPVPDGEVGEVVVTPMMVEAMPLIRFRTGDISFLCADKCSCGRNTPRLGPIIGRKKQMLKIKGTTIYPESIAVAIDQFGGVTEHYVEVEQAQSLSDRVVVHVSFTGDQQRTLELKEFLASRLRVRPIVVLESEAEIRQQVYSSRYRKPMRFFDRRVG